MWSSRSKRSEISFTQSEESKRQRIGHHHKIFNFWTPPSIDTIYSIATHLSLYSITNNLRFFCTLTQISYTKLNTEVLIGEGGSENWNWKSKNRAVQRTKIFIAVNNANLADNPTQHLTEFDDLPNHFRSAIWTVAVYSYKIRSKSIVHNILFIWGGGNSNVKTW